MLKIETTSLDYWAYINWGTLFGWAYIRGGGVIFGMR